MIRIAQTLLNDTDTRQYGLELLKSFILAVVKESPNKKLQAIFHRVLTVTIGMSSIYDSGNIHSIVIDTFKENKFELCRLSLRELQWGLENRWIQIKPELIEFPEESDHRIFSKDNIATLSLNNLKSFISQNNINMPEGYIEWNNDVIVSASNTFEQHKDVESILPEKNDNFCIFSEQSIGRPLNNVQTREYTDRGRVTLNPPRFGHLFVDCSHLLRAEKRKNYYEVKVIPGNSVTLVEQEDSRFIFEPAIVDSDHKVVIFYGI